MKKIHREISLKLSRRAILSWKKKLARTNLRGKKIQTIQEHVDLVEKLNISDNRSETIKCLQKFKRVLHKNPSKDVRRNVYINLTPVKDISVSAALVLAAEID